LARESLLKRLKLFVGLLSWQNIDDGSVMELKGKKVIVLGERDGVQGNSIALCAKSAGAEVVLELTHCFV
jgi:betaine reductase